MRSASGFVLGEGAAAIVLESNAAARGRGVNGVCRHRRYGTSSERGSSDRSVGGRTGTRMRAATGRLPAWTQARSTTSTHTELPRRAATSRRPLPSHRCSATMPATAAYQRDEVDARPLDRRRRRGGVRRNGLEFDERRRATNANWHTRDPQCHLDYVTEGARSLPQMRLALTIRLPSAAPTSAWLCARSSAQIIAQERAMNTISSEELFDVLVSVAALPACTWRRCWSIRGPRRRAGEGAPPRAFTSVSP